MIIKICEEMRTVRIDKDYMNYRTLVNILKEYAYNDIFNIVYNYNHRDSAEQEIIKQKSIVLSKWINSEINHIKELLNSSLLIKDYKNFKMLSQSDIELHSIDRKIKEVRFQDQDNIF